MSRDAISIAMPDGQARAFVFRPETSAGPWPGVLFLMDAPAIRPALFEMGQRLADGGYLVLLPDMFWRAGAYAPIDIRAVMRSDDARREAFTKLRGSTDETKQDADSGVFIDWLLRHADVAGRAVGVTGYCMGAGIALRAAGLHGERVASCAGFHGGRLATDATNSPHLLAPRIRAEVYVGGADEDAGFPVQQADRLRAALTAAGVRNTVEIYVGARHGYAPKDMPAYDEAAAERHWRVLFELFGRTLPRA